MKMVPSVIVIDEVKDSPSLRMDLPAVLPIGERLRFKTMIRRKNGNRTEELRVEGLFRVTEVVIDTTCVPAKQLLKVSSLGVTPSWRAIRNPLPEVRKLAPTRSRIIID